MVTVITPQDFEKRRALFAREAFNRTMERYEAKKAKDPVGAKSMAWYIHQEYGIGDMSVEDFGNYPNDNDNE